MTRTAPHSTGDVPTVFVVGPPKCATTTLHAHLASHPGLFLPAQAKEPHFFTGLRPHTPGRPQDLPPIHDLAEYRSWYAARRPGQAGVDVSPSYFAGPDVPARIHAVRPDARIVVLLRDPVRRAHSDHLMALRGGVETTPFPEYVARYLPDLETGKEVPGLTASRYGTHLRRWLSRFPRDQVHVIPVPDLHRDPAGTLACAAAFLGLDPDGFGTVQERRENVYEVPRNRFSGWLRQDPAVRRLAQVIPWPLRAWLDHRILLRPSPPPPLDESTAAALWNVFGPELDEAQALLGQDLSCLRPQM